MNTYFHAVYDAVGEAIRPVPRILLVITQWLLCVEPCVYGKPPAAHPIMTQEGDYLVLEHGSPLQRQVEAINSMKYHNLKMVAHVPLAINGEGHKTRPVPTFTAATTTTTVNTPRLVALFLSQSLCCHMS